MRGRRGSHFAVNYSGYLNAPKTGLYVFELRSCDGTKIKIDGKVVVDNDGLHHQKAKLCYVALEKGLHTFEMDYFKGKGYGNYLDLKWEGPGFTMRSMGSDDFRFKGIPGTPSLKLFAGKSSATLKSNTLKLSPEIDGDIDRVRGIKYWVNDLAVITRGHLYDSIDNLAKTAKLTASSPAQKGRPLEAAIDGDTYSTSGFTMDGSSNNWFQLDLGKSQKVSALKTVWYHHDKRFYTYDVEVSLNGKKWVKVAEKKSEELETRDGHYVWFKPVLARYVRLNHVKNSYNKTIHLCEIGLFSSLKDLVTTLPPLLEGVCRLKATLMYDEDCTAESNEVTLTSHNSLPLPYRAKTIAMGATAFGAAEKEGVFTLSGDSVGMVYREVEGDFTLTARLKNLRQSNSTVSMHRYTRIGLSVMRSIEDKDKKWHFGLWKCCKGTVEAAADYKDLAGIHTTIRDSTKDDWLRISYEKGGVWRGFTSPDGKKWTQIVERIQFSSRKKHIVGLSIYGKPSLSDGQFYGSLDNVKFEKKAYRGAVSTPVSAKDLISKNRTVSLIIDETYPERLTARTTKKGIARSEDGGQSWSRIDGNLKKNPAAQSVRSIAVHPTNSAIILRAAGKVVDGKLQSGIWRTQDGGKNWKLVCDQVDANGESSTALLGEIISFNPRDPNIVVAGNDSAGLFRSEDAGETWQSIGLQGECITSLAFMKFQKGLLIGTSDVKELKRLGLKKIYPTIKSHPGRLYKMNDAATGKPRIIVEKKDWGVTNISFERMDASMYYLASTNGLYYKYFGTVAKIHWYAKDLYPADRLWIGLDCFYGKKARWAPSKFAAPFSTKDQNPVLGAHVSMEWAPTWSHLSKEVKTGAQLNAGITGITHHPVDHKVLYVCNRHGIFKSSDLGKSFELIFVYK